MVAPVEEHPGKGRVELEAQDSIEKSIKEVYGIWEPDCEDISKDQSTVRHISNKLVEAVVEK